MNTACKLCKQIIFAPPAHADAPLEPAARNLQEFDRMMGLVMIHLGTFHQQEAFGAITGAMQLSGKIASLAYTILGETEEATKQTWAATILAALEKYTQPAELLAPASPGVNGGAPAPSGS